MIVPYSAQPLCSILEKKLSRYLIPGGRDVEIKFIFFGQNLDFFFGYPTVIWSSFVTCNFDRGRSPLKRCAIKWPFQICFNFFCLTWNFEKKNRKNRHFWGAEITFWRLFCVNHHPVKFLVFFFGPLTSCGEARKLSKYLSNFEFWHPWTELCDFLTLTN